MVILPGERVSERNRRAAVDRGAPPAPRAGAPPDERDTLASTRKRIPDIAEPHRKRRRRNEAPPLTAKQNQKAR